jgi:hypothetical protein
MWLRAFFVFASMKIGGLIAYFSAMQWNWSSSIEYTALAIWMTGLAGLLLLAAGTAMADAASWLRTKLKANRTDA